MCLGSFDVRIYQNSLSVCLCTKSGLQIHGMSNLFLAPVRIGQQAKYTSCHTRFIGKL